MYFSSNFKCQLSFNRYLDLNNVCANPALKSKIAEKITTGDLRFFLVKKMWFYMKYIGMFKKKRLTSVHILDIY